MAYKKNLITVLACCAVGYFFYIALPQKSTLEPRARVAKVGVVDIDAILAEPKGKLNAQLDAIIKKYHAEFKGYETEFRTEHESLADQKKNIKTAPINVQKEWAQRKDIFEARVLATQKTAEKCRDTLSRAHQQVLEKMHGLLFELIQAEGRKRDMDLVVPTGQTIYWRSTLDLTAAIHEKLAQELATASFDLEKATADVRQSETL